MRRLRAALLSVVLLGAGPLVTGPTGELRAQHNCNYCHDVHGGIADSGVALNREAVIEDMCATCHSAAGPGYLVGPDLVNDTVTSSLDFVDGIHNGSYHAGTPTSCWDCHDHQAEAGANLAMIPETRTLPASAGGGSATVVFTSNTAQADFTGATGICNVCHTDPTVSATSTSGHNGPDVCTTCHDHEGGFQGSGGACTTCHNAGKGNHREVVSEFDRASHHVQLGGPGADIPEADCTVCHNQTGHPRTGTDHVVLINQDDLSTINYEPGVTATSVLTPFCLSCHDADGGQGGDTSPFSDGIVRPEIDEAAWSASSHGTNQECADCHEVHGSEKVTLFKPGNVAPNPTTKVEEEEGFCFGCHDGGTASTDIQAQFTPAINWSASAWGINNITTFNDRHDVQHAASSVSGAKIECVDCHNPHADNSGQKYDPDPDPANAAVTWTGQTTLDAFCVDCHDNTFPTGVTGHTGGAMVDIATAFVGNDSHGVPTTATAMHNVTVAIEATLGMGDTQEEANPWTSPALMSCIQCHRPHPKAAGEWPGTVAYDLFSLQDTVRAPDGRGMAYWEDVSVMGQTTRQYFWDYGLTEDDSRAVTEPTAGGYYCNTCHDRRGMNGKNTCGASGCHRHGGKL